MNEQRTPGLTIAGVLVLSVAVGLVAWLVADLWPALIAAWPGDNDDLVRVLQVVRDSRVDIGCGAGSVTLAAGFVLAQAWWMATRVGKRIPPAVRWARPYAWPVAQPILASTSNYLGVHAGRGLASGARWIYQLVQRAVLIRWSRKSRRPRRAMRWPATQPHTSNLQTGAVTGRSIDKPEVPAPVPVLVS